LDGRGGERAPDIAKSARVQRLSDSEIFHIVENGVPGTGMPAFHSFASSDTKALVTYLRTLQGAKRVVSVPGNVERGKALFVGKAGCSGCHMAGGNGGFIATDLSTYARTHTVEETRNAIIHPVNGDRQVRLATATIRGGEKYTGRVRNEDNFSVQLQTLDGAFHFLSKSDLESMDYGSQPLMPSDYRSTLNPKDLDDIVSYLITIANAPAPEIHEKKPSKHESEED
jgi:cytochrome c oxidase cbb3-type subunit III